MTESPSERTSPPAVRVRPIESDDVSAVCRFLHASLNERVTPDAWRALFNPPWGHRGPHHGFQLVDDESNVLGAYVAVYSERSDGRRICNAAAFCVLPEHRQHAARLALALSRQKGFVITDLSPSGNVPALNLRLGFEDLDTSTRLVLNGPHLRRFPMVTDEQDRIGAVLTGADAEVYRDHRLAPAARHLVVIAGQQYAYLVYRRDRRKGLPVFATPLYAGGDNELLQHGWSALGSHLLRRGLPVTLAEHRVLGFTPPGAGRGLSVPRRRMHKGGSADQVDYLYSELVLVQW